MDDVAAGHLALWAAGRSHARNTSLPGVHIRAVVGLAPVADLAEAYVRKIGGEAVVELLGGTAGQYPDRLRAASPMEMLPLRVRQIILHGTADDAVPIELARGYARAEAAGDTVEILELPGTGHMEYLDPDSDAHAILRRWLLASTPPLNRDVRPHLRIFRDSRFMPCARTGMGRTPHTQV